ncbi:MAG TPA: pitrilysin family protein [Bdellovibrionota bacterium]|jgi:zinc protease|nr:pitrilysin family protein [Bdellovibrionota bacterium]
MRATKVFAVALLPFLGSLQIQKTTLPNGLKLLVVEDHSSPTFAYQTWFKVGSRDEVPKFTGLAHLFEHLMFKATKNHPEGDLDRILGEAGVEDKNAFTTNDHTAYHESMPKNGLELVMSIESDRMVNLVVDDKTFKTEREVVQNERRYRDENNPVGIMYRNLFELSFKKSTYRWPVIGYEEDLNRMKASDAAAFYKAHYRPSNATVVVVGDVDGAEVLKLANKYYGPISNEGAVAPAKAIPEPAPLEVRRKRLTLGLQAEKVMVAFRAPPGDSPDVPALNVLEAILTDGNASRLRMALVEKGVATSIGSGSFDMRDPSVFLFFADLQKGKSSKAAEEAILKELQRLGTERVGDAELERAKNLVRFDFYSGLQGNDSKAEFIARYETDFGSYKLGLDHMDAVAQVTPDDLLRVAKAYFNPSSRMVITGVPKSEKGSAKK